MKSNICRTIVILLILIVMSACQAGGGTNNMTPAQATTDPALRRLPTEGFNASADGSQLSGDYYEFPGGAFKMKVPAGWVEETDESGSLYMYEPAGEGAIFISINNTGHELSEDEFNNFVDARETNFFDDFYDLVAGDRSYDDTRDYVLAQKSVTFNDIPEFVDTYYFHKGQAIYALDFWMEADREADYRQMYAPLLASFETNSSVIDDFEIYNYIEEFRDTAGDFSFEVPLAWIYGPRVEAGVVTDNFYSPSYKAIIQHVLFYNKSSLSQDDILQKIYLAAQDLFDEGGERGEVGQFSELEGGGTYILWAPDGGGWQMETIYYEYEGKILALTGMIDENYIDIYQSTIDYGFDWYSVPALAQE